MERLQEVLEKYLNENLKKMIISNPRDRKKAAKISLRPVLLKEALAFQACEYLGNKVYHKNFPKETAIHTVLGWAEEYRQLDIFSQLGQATVLISKKGKVTVKEKAGGGCMGEVDLSHNRKKKYILDPGEKVGFLIDLGVQSQEGKIIHAKYDKFRQINRFLEFIEDVLPQLPKDREVTIVDFGCGKSYLSFAMYHYLKKLKGYQVHIIGLDLKEDVIAECSRLAGKYGYQGLDFYVGDIAHFQEVERVDMVVTLHACDTATDYALARAVQWNARVILSVPCCQHEMNRQLSCDALAPVLRYGLVKERMAALMTDAVRANLLEQYGYDTQILEFIDMEHTPKNILIRAVRKNHMKYHAGTKMQEELTKLEEFLHISPTLQTLLEQVE